MIERGAGGEGVTVNDVVEAIYRRLCDHQRRHGALAGMSLAELRLALGVRAEQLDEAVRIARISGDLFIRFMARNRVVLGRSWRERCDDEAGRPPVGDPPEERDEEDL
jgi:hypothetical protein